MSKRTLNYNLERPKDRNVWFVVIDVPPSLRKAMGTKRLRKTTGTDDILKARIKRHTILSDLKKRIATFKSKATWGSEGEPLGQALFLKIAMENTNDHEQHNDLIAETNYITEEIERKEGYQAAKSFHDVATGVATPLDLYLEDWLREKQYGERQQADFRNWVKRLASWLNAVGTLPTLEAVTDKAASAFKTKSLIAAGLHHKTANKIMSGLRSYWRWLELQGHVTRNPWLGKSLPKRDAPRDELERAFNDDEVQSLFAGVPDKVTGDAMLISALSGMRLDEMFQLKIKHCQDGLFKVAYGAEGKTKAAERIVPIHSKLKATILRLCGNRGGEEYLMSETSKGWGKNRSMAVSKRFATYRRGVGVDEKLQGKRRSLVNFHSFRRWFITKADQAGCRKEDIERVVGHKPQGMSLGVYSAGITVEQGRKVVESVKLPRSKR